ncbi:hypothetical protein KEM55_004330 [Ascosphaera atra]|nr:hypothetical protein KEM55_004330 [Ascosphaera atra]
MTDLYSIPPQASASEPASSGDDTSDPVIASYDILITDAFINRILLQYPDRQASFPYNESTSQKPTELRLKPATGLVEVDIPLNTRLNYDEQKGLRYGNALRKSNVMNAGGSFGMTGGFITGGAAASSSGSGVNGKGKGASTKEIIMGDDEEIDGYESNDDRRAGVLLTTQTLGGRLMPPAEGEPVYMLGAFKDNELHLSPLAGVVQLRPQLHHLDALDDLSLQKKAASKGKGGDDAEPEARAIDMRVKSTNTERAETGGQSNNELLKKIQEERWERFVWVDENDEESWDHYEEYMFNPSPETLASLESKISSEDYIDEMSAPRIDPIYPELAGQAMKLRRHRLDAS